MTSCAKPTQAAEVPKLANEDDGLTVVTGTAAGTTAAATWTTSGAAP